MNDLFQTSDGSAVTLSSLLDTLTGRLVGWAEAAAAMLPNLAVAILWMVAAWYGSKVVARLAQKGLDRVSENRQITELISGLLRHAVLVAGLFVALGILDLDKTVTSLLAGVGVIGLALGFAFQDIAANFISGVLMAFRSEFGDGDLIETNGLLGRVSSVNLRTTMLRRPDGVLIALPNQAVFGSPLVNLTASPRRRVDIPVGVSYDDDLDSVKRVAIRAIEALECRAEDEPIDVLFTSFGGSSIDLEVRFWIDRDSRADFLSARSEAIQAIKSAFDDAGIDIPYPIRTLKAGAEVEATLRRMQGRADAGHAPHAEA